MAKVTPIAFEASEEDYLKVILKKSLDWQALNRSETILLLSAGHSIQAAAEQQNLCG